MQWTQHWISTWNGLLWNRPSFIWHFLTWLPSCRAHQCCQFYLFFPEHTLNSLIMFIVVSDETALSVWTLCLQWLITSETITFLAEISHASIKLEVHIVSENLGGGGRTPLIHLWGLDIPISVCTIVFDDLLIPIKSTPLFFPLL